MKKWTTKQNWQYNGLLGGISMAKGSMSKIFLHPATSARARNLATEIQVALVNLDRELRDNKKEKS